MNDIKETEDSKKKRWRSIRILCITMFFDSLAFSVVLSSIWPYLQKVDPSHKISPIYVGWANIAFQFSGIMIDFVMGFWVNSRGSKEPLIVSMGLFGFGSLLYAYAESMGNYGVAIVIVSRAVIGFSTGIDVIARSVIAQSTTLRERTGAMSQMSIAQGVGFSCGPALQLVLIPLGDGGLYFKQLKLHLNLYTAPAFASILIAIFNVILIVVWYREYRIDIYQDHENKDRLFNFNLVHKENGRSPTKAWDICAVIVILFLYFTGQNAFAFQETILAPLAMYEFAWSKEETALWVAVIFLISGMIAIVMFAVTECLERRFNDRCLLIFGFIMLSFGFAFFLPWGKGLPIIKHAGVANSTKSETVFSNEFGCPHEYLWCHDTPRIYLSQIIIGMVFLSIGYPFVMVVSTTLYSKILGPNPQGIMQSWLAAAGGLARCTGPALVTYLLVSEGPRWTFLSIEALLILALAVTICSLGRLIPYHKYILTNKTVITGTQKQSQHLITYSISSSSSSGNCSLESVTV